MASLFPVDCDPCLRFRWVTADTGRWVGYFKYIYVIGAIGALFGTRQRGKLQGPLVPCALDGSVPLTRPTVFLHTILRYSYSIVLSL